MRSFRHVESGHERDGAWHRTTHLEVNRIALFHALLEECDDIVCVAVEGVEVTYAVPAEERLGTRYECDEGKLKNNALASFDGEISIARLAGVT